MCCRILQNLMKCVITLKVVTSIFERKKSIILLVCLQLERELEVCEKESGELQEYANSVLQQIADYCPDILEQVVNALEESC